MRPTAATEAYGWILRGGSEEEVLSRFKVTMKQVLEQKRRDDSTLFFAMKDPARMEAARDVLTADPHVAPAVLSRILATSRGHTRLILNAIAIQDIRR